MIGPDCPPRSYTSWTNDQLIAWANGLGDTVRPYLPALNKSGVCGKWLSCLTDADLVDLGIAKIGHRQVILFSIECLIDEFNVLETENLQSVLFAVVRRLAIIASLLKQVHDSPTVSAHLDHSLFKAMINLDRAAHKAATWLARSPFGQIAKMSTLRGVVAQQTMDLNTALQSAFGNANVGAYVNAMQEIVRGLRDKLEQVIHDCEDSLMLTPCSIELVSLQKPEAGSYGFTFHTTAFNVHIIDSLDANVNSHAFSCGKMSKDDEIVDVNDQTVLEWTHEAVVALIQRNPQRLTLRIRKRPSHCTDFFTSTNSHHQQNQLPNSLRPRTAEPQHSRRSDVLRNRTPKRRTQPAPISPSSSANASTKITAAAAAAFRPNITTNAAPPVTGETRDPPLCEVVAVTPRKPRRRSVTVSSMDDLPSDQDRQCFFCSGLERGRDCASFLWFKKKKKKAGGFAGSKYVRRWCVFKQNTLYYYRNPEDASAEGLIQLPGFTVSPLTTPPESTGGRYPFSVCNDWTKCVFAAETEGGRTRWMNLLGLAAIGQSACVWEGGPIGGFHPGYLCPAMKEGRSLPPSPSPNACEATYQKGRPQTAGAAVPSIIKSIGGDSSGQSPVAAIHRCSSSLAVPSGARSTNPLPLKKGGDGSGGPSHPYLSVSASYLGVSCGGDGDSSNHATGVQVTEEADQSPCRLMRRIALIRRRRVRRLTDGSISPSVYLTSPPMRPPPTDRLSLPSQTFVKQESEDDEEEEEISQSGDLRQVEGAAMASSTITTGLSPQMSLSSRSESTTDQTSSI